MGISCTFDATGSSDSDGSISSFEWTFGDGDEAGGPTPQKDFVETGTYDVTLTVTDDGGLTSSVTHQVDVVKPNVPPTASFTIQCDYLDCGLDATASTDGDGTVDDYAWDFGDGETGSGSTPSRVYSGPGSYAVTLVVTDDEGATGETSSSQVVVGEPAPSTVSYVGGTAGQGNSSTPNVTTPTTASGGDRLVLILSLNASSRILADPTSVTDWTVLGTTTSGSMLTRAYTKIATAGDASRRVTVALDAAHRRRRHHGLRRPAGHGGPQQRGADGVVHHHLHVPPLRPRRDRVGRRRRHAGDVRLGLRGRSERDHDGPICNARVRRRGLVRRDADRDRQRRGHRQLHRRRRPGGGAPESVVRTTHTAPAVEAGAGDWVVSYWADKSSATTQFTVPGEVTARQAVCSANAGRICSVLADSGAPVSAGTYGPLTAAADAASGTATMWSILLRQAG